MVGIGLVLLTPFVVTPATIAPFTVGKALWSRSIIEIVFALWVLLALLKPAWRPPPSRILLLLAVELGVGFLAGLLGVGLERSLWSNYETMAGLVDGVHWFALAVVLAAMVRTPAMGRLLLAFSVMAGVVMAGIAMASHGAMTIPFYGDLPEYDPPRIGGPLGNPIHLSAYMLANGIIALGLMARSWTMGAPSPWLNPRRVVGTIWLLAALIQFRGLMLSGSVGGGVGLLAAAGWLGLILTFLAHGRRRWLAAATLAGVVLLGLGAGSRFFASNHGGSWLSGSPMDHVAGVRLQRPGVQSRLAAWRAGLEGVAERPLLGWGPGNFGTVFGRFASGYGATAKAHDHAHSKLMEVAVTTGAVGLLAHGALWSCCFLVLWRAADRAPPANRPLIVFVGAALAGGFVQGQSLVDSPSGTMQTTVLLGFVAGLEPMAFPAVNGRTLAPQRQTAWRQTAWRWALGAAALMVSTVGLLANLAILRAARIQHVPKTLAALPAMARAIDGFPPLASTWRLWLFNALTRHWHELREQDQALAHRVLVWAEQEAAAIRRHEPQNWRSHHGIARMVQVAAATEPRLAPQAMAAQERARALAPNRALWPRTPAPPVVVEAVRHKDGRHGLRWEPSPGAGYHVVAEDQEDGRSRALLHVYDSGQTTWIRPQRLPAGSYRYRIKACNHPQACSPSVYWLPISEPPVEPGPRW